jgi:hypothetical protein
MLRRNLCTRRAALVSVAALAITGLATSSASAFENVLYRGTVEVSSPAARGWAPQNGDGKQYVLDLRLSLPRELNANVGTTTYKAIGGIVVCRGTVRLVEIEKQGAIDGQQRAGTVLLAESRRSPSTRKASSGKRRAISRARKWCRRGAWRMSLGYDSLLDPPAERVGLRNQPYGWSRTYYLARKP